MPAGAASAPRLVALLLAGSRPGVDPLAVAFDAPAKALVRVAGEAMLSRVARTLADHPAIARVVVLAQDAALLTGQVDTVWLADDSRIAFETAGGSVSEAVAEAVKRHVGALPILVTTADHALLDDAILDAFIGPALATGADVVVGLVEQRVLKAAYPDNRRTWLRFHGGAWSGANLFLITDLRALAAFHLWRGIEQQRKKGRAIVAAFGPLMLAGVALRLFDIHAALRRAGRRLGLTAAAIPLPIAEACIDVDSPADHALVTEILAARA